MKLYKSECRGITGKAIKSSWLFVPSRWDDKQDFAIRLKYTHSHFQHRIRIRSPIHNCPLCCSTVIFGSVVLEWGQEGKEWVITFWKFSWIHFHHLQLACSSPWFPPSCCCFWYTLTISWHLFGFAPFVVVFGSWQLFLCIWGKVSLVKLNCAKLFTGITSFRSFRNLNPKSHEHRTKNFNKITPYRFVRKSGQKTAKPANLILMRWNRF